MVRETDRAPEPFMQHVDDVEADLFESRRVSRRALEERDRHVAARQGAQFGARWQRSRSNQCSARSAVPVRHGVQQAVGMNFARADLPCWHADLAHHVHGFDRKARAQKHQVPLDAHAPPSPAIVKGVNSMRRQ